MYNVVQTFFVKLLLLGLADNIVRRSNTTAHIADYIGVEPECPERLNFHFYSEPVESNRCLRILLVRLWRFCFYADINLQVPAQ